MLPVRPHLKQQKVCCSRLTEKQRLVPGVDRCKEHGPRCCAPWLVRDWKPSSCRTADIVTRMRTAVKSIGVCKAGAASAGSRAV